jgi:uncharacterized protein YggL (DUF469 family)
MSDEKDTHDLLIETMMEYCKCQDRFEHKGSDEAGVKARVALNDIRKLCIQRRDEIQKKRIERRKLRNTKKGRPFNITIGSY